MKRRLALHLFRWAHKLDHEIPASPITVVRFDRGAGLLVLTGAGAVDVATLEAETTWTEAS